MKYPESLFFSFILFLFISNISVAQNPKVIIKRVVDESTGRALPYTNIYNPRTQSGVISNEDGYFTLDISNLDNTDFIRFQYVGYSTRNIAIGDLEKMKSVYLKGRIMDIAEMVIYGNPMNAREIVEKVLVNKDNNYKKSIKKQKIFVRSRETTTMIDKIIDFKKSNIPLLNKALFARFLNGIPNVATSFSDCLGIGYSNENLPDSAAFKLNPIRTVVLKEKDFASLDEIEKIMENALKDVKDNEFWKLRSGIISQKMDTKKDTVKKERKDSIPKDHWYTDLLSSVIWWDTDYASLDDRRLWQFLHKTNRYKYSLVGGTSVNGEDVYVIDFKPGIRGLYKGRMFISTETYALVKADYEYAPGKDGITFDMFGIAYKELGFSGSIYFVKKGDDYQLKYFSRRTNTYFKFDRNVSLVKKKDRFLFDKKQNQIKLGIKMAANMEESVEYLVMNDQTISAKAFEKATQPEFMKINYVDQFDDRLWQNYDIIEPTRQMRAYKKHKE
jgi:hypothetical protein